MFVSRSKLAELIRQTNKFYTVQFVRRSDNQKRIMNCRNGVKKHLAGGVATYNAEDHNLINTYSIDASGYRSIPIENLIGATIEGTTFLVRD